MLLKTSSSEHFVHQVFWFLFEGVFKAFIYLCTYLLIYLFNHLLIIANDTFTTAGQRSSSVPHSPRILPPKSLGIERIHFRKSSINEQFVDTRQSRWEVTLLIKWMHCSHQIFSPKWSTHFCIISFFLYKTKSVICGDISRSVFKNSFKKTFGYFFIFKVCLVYIKL